METSTTLCASCAKGPTGETGHDALEFYVVGPYPGHSIFNCTDCGERWIRHYGMGERHGWTRYTLQFPIRRPREPDVALRRRPAAAA